MANLFLMMLPEDFLVEFLPARRVRASEGRWLVVAHVEPQIFYTSVQLAAYFALDGLVTCEQHR